MVLLICSFLVGIFTIVVDSFTLNGVSFTFGMSIVNFSVVFSISSVVILVVVSLRRIGDDFVKGSV